MDRRGFFMLLASVTAGWLTRGLPTPILPSKHLVKLPRSHFKVIYTRSRQEDDLYGQGIAELLPHYLTEPTEWYVRPTRS